MSGHVRVLYVDDYPMDRALVRDALVKESQGFELVEAASRQEFESLLGQGDYDVVLSDFNILGFEGLQVIAAVHLVSPDLPVIIVTGTGSEEIAVQALKNGASDYVIKSPHHIQHLPFTIQNVLEARRLQADRERQRAELQDAYRFVTSIVETSPAALVVLNSQARIALWNKAAERTFGWELSEIGGREVSVRPRGSPRGVCRPAPKSGAGRAVSRSGIVRPAERRPVDRRPVLGRAAPLRRRCAGGRPDSHHRYLAAQRSRTTVGSLRKSPP